MNYVLFDLSYELIMIVLCEVFMNTEEISRKSLKIFSSSGPDTTTSLILPAEQEAVGMSNTQLEERMIMETVEASLGLPRSRQYIEDEGPEWRELDFYVDVGTPPSTFCLFFQQYDWSIYSGESLTTQVRKYIHKDCFSN